MFSWLYKKANLCIVMSINNVLLNIVKITPPFAKPNVLCVRFIALALFSFGAINSLLLCNGMYFVVFQDYKFYVLRKLTCKLW